jgi:hypothetical protein
MATPEQILIEMGIDPEEANQRDIELTTTQRGDRRVCLCGHSMNRHSDTVIAGRYECVVGRKYCPCKKPQPVLNANDTRSFIRTTKGSGLDHALTRGIAAAIKLGTTIEWIPEARHCHPCGKAEDGLRLTAMSVTENGFPADYETGYNALFCDKCRTDR